jgi:phosphate transport system substrate-binding protein
MPPRDLDAGNRSSLVHLRRPSRTLRLLTFIETVQLKHQEYEVNATSIRRAIVPAVAALALGSTLAACGAGNEAPTDTTTTTGAAALTGTLAGGGSSAQEKAQAAWTAGVQTANPDLTINYEPVGSGDGRANFINGGYAFAGTDSALTDDEGELAAAKKRCGGDPIQIPAYVSPIAVMYNLKGVDNLALDADTISAIFEGKITKWNDAAIVATNPNAKLPATAIAPVHRSDDSGTTKNFLTYLSEAGNFKPAVDSIWPLKGGEAAEGTSGVVGVVSKNEGTIGYADNSATEGLQVAKLKVGDEFVAPSAEAAAKILSISKPAGLTDNDLAVDLARDTKDATVYPNVLVSYLLACQKYDDAATAKLVKGYLTYVLSEAGQTAASTEAGSAPLERDLADQGLALVDSIS